MKERARWAEGGVLIPLRLLLFLLVDLLPLHSSERLSSVTLSAVCLVRNGKRKEASSTSLLSSHVLF